LIEAVDPSRYSVTGSLRDGRRVEIRAVQPTDRPGLDGALASFEEFSIRRDRGMAFALIVIPRSIGCVLPQTRPRPLALR
jgi:hypothetical protein